MIAAGLQHCRIERDADDIAWLTLDMDGASVNTLSSALIASIETALDRILDNGMPVALVIQSAKADGFLVGADAEELERMLDQAHADAFIRRGQALTARIAELDVPTVALVHGRCRGGGMELAVACRYRVADADTALCLPEVHLGLHPCFGGTARLADLIGATPTLALAVSGRVVGSSEARRRGLVDAVRPRAEHVDAARDLVRRRPAPRRPRGLNRALSLRPVWWLMERVREADDLRDFAPETRIGADALRMLWRRHGGHRLPRRIEAERVSVLALLRQAPAHNLIRVYGLTERCLADATRSAGATSRRVHVVGAGELGTDVAATLAGHGFAVTLTDADEAAIDRAMQRVRARGAELSGLVADPAGAGVAAADLVIEAIDEDLERKIELFGTIEASLADDAVLATTTSTLAFDRLAGALARPQRLVALHFARELVDDGLGQVIEIGHGAITDEAAIARAAAVATALGRLPLHVRAAPVFLIERLLVPYMLEGARGYSRGEREVIDGAARYLGMAVGPLELADWIGLDRCLALAEAMAAHQPMAIPATLREQVANGRLGWRTGGGFHDWRGDKRVTGSPPPGARARFPRIGQGLVAPMLAQAELCLEEGMVDDGDLIDVAGVMAAGVPGHTGGPLSWARRLRHG